MPSTLPFIVVKEYVQMIWGIEAVLAHVHDGKAPPSMHGFKSADTRKPPFATRFVTRHCIAC
jgi:hypothetical protein